MSFYMPFCLLQTCVVLTINTCFIYLVDWAALAKQWMSSKTDDAPVPPGTIQQTHQAPQTPQTQGMVHILVLYFREFTCHSHM